MQRQLARVLAHLALLPAAAPVVGSDPFATWLRGVVDDYSTEVAALQGQGLPSATRKLASHAQRAMLNAEAVMLSMQDGGDAAPAALLPRFGDGLFFFQPGSETANGQGCVLDVVFIHGLRAAPSARGAPAPQRCRAGPRRQESHPSLVPSSTPPTAAASPAGDSARAAR